METKTKSKKWNLLAVGLLLTTAIVLLSTFRHYGIGWDESVHHEYGRLIAKFYLSGFTDDSSKYFSDLIYYGGFFEVWMGFIDILVNKKSFPIWEVRHLTTGVFGLFGLWGAYLLVLRVFKSQRTAFLTLILLLTHPILYGHLLINSKDIPFLTGYVWSVFYLLKILEHLPGFSAKNALLLGVWIGITSGIRMGGTVLYLYTAVFVSMGLILCLWKKETQWGPAFISGLKTAFVVFPLSYAWMLAFWPWAQDRPFANLMEALARNENFQWTGFVLYDGKITKGIELPWHYLPKMLLIQTPEIILMGLVVALVFAISRIRKVPLKQQLNTGLIVFAAIFPVAFILIKSAHVYDGFRHVLFVTPFFVILAALGLNEVLSFLESRRRLYQQIASVLICGFILSNIVMMIRLHPYEYTYFNQLAGGPREAYKRYDSDYWGMSLLPLMKQFDKAIQAGKFGDSTPSITAGIGNPDSSLIVYAERSSYFEYIFSPRFADYWVSMTRVNMHELKDTPIVLKEGRFGHDFAVMRVANPPVKAANLKKPE